jgi:hypothetical protein
MEAPMIPSHRSMSGAKRALSKFIYEYLPPLLAQQGRMRKEDARTALEKMFRERYGWPKELDEREKPGRPMSSNAWGWALHWLFAKGVTKRCSGSQFYELASR